MKKRTKKILKWVIIIGVIAVALYFVSQSGDSNLFAVTNSPPLPSSIGAGSGGGIVG